MRRRWFWALVSATTAMVVAVAVVLALPEIVRRVAVRQLEARTGRAVSIERVALNLFTRHLVVTGLTVEGERDEPALARLARLDAHVQLWPVLRGGLHIERLALSGPAVHVVRGADGSVSAARVLQRLLAVEPRKVPIALTLEDFRLEDGRVTLEDRAVAPHQTWRLEKLDVEGRRLTTTTDEPTGTVAATFTLAGAPGRLTAEAITLRPPARGRGRLTLGEIDLAPFAPYVRDLPIELAGGRVAGHQTFTFAAPAVTLADGGLTLTKLVMRRPGQDPPLVTADPIVLASHDVRYDGGRIAAGRLELTTSATITEAGRAYDVTNAHLVVENAHYPDGPPARVALTAGLPAGGSLDARGTLATKPVVANLAVRLADIDLALAVPYVPPGAAATIGGGHVSAALDVRYARPADVDVSGEVGIHRLTVVRRGQSEPFVRHPRVRARITGLAMRGRDLAVKRLAITGSPTIVDASVSPAARFDFTSLSLTVEDATWPSRGPARVTGAAALSDGSTGRLAGRLDPGTLAADIGAAFTDVAVTRLQPYISAAAPVTLQRGAASAEVTLTNDRSAGVRLSAKGTVRDLAVALRGQREPLVTDPRVAFEVRDVAVKGGAVAGRRVAITAAPTVVDRTAGRPRPLAFRGVEATIDDVAWPARTPARVRLVADLPQAGRLQASGTADLGTRAVALAIDVHEAALAPYAAFAPISAPIGGTVDAALGVQGSAGSPLALAVSGSVMAYALTLGPPDHLPVWIKRVEISGLHASWPEHAHVDRALIVDPYLLVEREKDGRLALRPMLARPGSQPTGAAAGPAPPPGQGAPAPDERGVALEIDEATIDNGTIRYVDRTTTPFYSEELSSLAITTRALDSRREKPSDVELQAVLGGSGALELHGQVAPFARPFFLEVQGEIRSFAVARTNPYLSWLTSWIARRGELSTTLHYRVVGREIAGSNDIVVRGLDVEPARGEEVGRAIGLPLALVVSLLKNPAGDIKLSIPVSGDLGSPRFSFGDAVVTALQHLVTKVVTGPFAAIGRVFSRGEGEPAALQVEPVEFRPGSVTVDEPASHHLQRVADFLRASPHVELAMRPVITGRDLSVLRAQELAARLQYLQREQRVDWRTAARRLFAQRYPGRPVPDAIEGVLDALREQERPADAAVRKLGELRVEATRRNLVEAAGIQPQRLIAAAQPTVTEAGGTPRVEFDLEP